MNAALVISATAIVFWYSFYYHKVCSNQEYYSDDPTVYPNPSRYELEILDPLKKLLWILFLCLMVIFFTVGCIMLRKLRQYYKGFFKEFGCYLWTANILLTLPLSIRAIVDGLTLVPAWQNYWFPPGDPDDAGYKASIYNVTIFLLATYIPMLMQIFTLIFGFMRNKKVKLLSTFGTKDSKQ